MKQKKLNFIKCECENQISIRSLARHLKSRRFEHSKRYKDHCLNLIDLFRINKYAWLISEGLEAKLDESWCFKILDGIHKLEDFSFASPRPKGRMTPTGSKKLSTDRVGKGNPSLINKPVYDVATIKKIAIQTFKDLSADPAKFKKLDDFLDKQFPDYRYSFVEMRFKHGEQRGHNRRNLILSFLIDKSVEWIIKNKAIDRGKFISMGQLKSPNLIKMANAGRKALKSHVSLAHNVLFNMILSVDSKSVKEKQIDCGSTWKSYDIFSPKLNLLIEMHGHVWHDLNKCTSKLIPLVEKNIENDKIKISLAEKNGYNLEIFWDDQTDKWGEQIEKIYEKKSKSYEQALREETDKKRKCGSV